MDKWCVESGEKKRGRNRGLVIITSKSKEKPQKCKQPKLIRYFFRALPLVKAEERN